jgi:hypothetical protein
MSHHARAFDECSADRMIRTARPVLLHAAAAAIGAALLVWLGPPGTDLAAHVYQRGVFIAHGFTFWNNFWYAGRYSFVTYSLLYYPLAAVIGIKLLAVLSTGVAAGAFALLVRREWSAVGPWPAVAFTGVSALWVESAAFPYTLGLACALLALLALSARRLLPFSACVLLTFAASPLAFVLLAVVLAGVAASRSSRDMLRPGAVVLATAAVGAVLWRAFPDRGLFPYSLPQLAASLAFCAAGLLFTWRVERARVLRFFFGIYAVACLAAFAIPSGLGENVGRFRFVAIPIAVLALSLRRWQPLVPAVIALALATSWNLTPIAYSFVRGSSDPSAEAAYWQPVVRYLRRELPASYRVEAVDTTGHWPAVYLARAGVPIVRGWFRQDDFPQNRILYAPLRAPAYVSWLRRMGVGYVVLTDAPADYSSKAEAALLRSGSSGLATVLRTRHTTVYAVPHPVSMLTGPGRPRVLALRAASVTVALSQPGRYRLALRYSPYWTSPGICISERPDGMVQLVSPRSGVVRLAFSVTATRAVAAVAGVGAQCA